LAQARVVFVKQQALRDDLILAWSKPLNRKLKTWAKQTTSRFWSLVSQKRRKKGRVRPSHVLISKWLVGKLGEHP
jgi:hypothetical protein